MLNYRKPIIYLLLASSGGAVIKSLNLLRSFEDKSTDELQNIQKKSLNQLLIHSYLNVPYYKRVLKDAGVINEELKVDLVNFNNIPYLDKEILRKEGKNLHSVDHKRRKSYENSSGGSTGEPAIFLQDRYYWDLNGIATKIFYHEILGKELGESEVDVWGSERDVFRNSMGTKERLINRLYNRTILNSFVVDDDKLKYFVEKINNIKPVDIWAYVESIDLLSRYIQENKLKIYSPKFIISTSGTLYTEIRNRVEKVFKCPVYDQYGAREVGPIGIECKEKNGFHAFPYLNYLETGKDNELVITLLTNYSMPLIRYKIGDEVIMMKDKKCSCGRKYKIIKEVRGKTVSHFKTEGGKIIHGQLFIRQFFFLDWVKKFQIVQISYNKIECNIVLQKKKNIKDIHNLRKRFKHVMGNSCKIDFKFVNEIKPSKSGKYLYAISEVK